MRVRVVCRAPCARALLCAASLTAVLGRAHATLPAPAATTASSAPTAPAATPRPSDTVKKNVDEEFVDALKMNLQQDNYEYAPPSGEVRRAAVARALTATLRTTPDVTCYYDYYKSRFNRSQEALGAEKRRAFDGRARQAATDSPSEPAWRPTMLEPKSAASPHEPPLSQSARSSHWPLSPQLSLLPRRSPSPQSARWPRWPPWPRYESQPRPGPPTTSTSTPAAATTTTLPHASIPLLIAATRKGLSSPRLTHRQLKNAIADMINKNLDIMIESRTRGTRTTYNLTERSERNVSLANSTNAKDSLQVKRQKFKEFIHDHRDLFVKFISNKRMAQTRAHAAPLTPLPRKRTGYARPPAHAVRSGTQSTLKPNFLIHKRRGPAHAKEVFLDMGPARDYRLEAMKEKGRVCQRHVLLPEGPKYDSKGAVYLLAYKPVQGRDFAETREPSLVLPRCCNCCQKSVLGCD